MSQHEFSPQEPIRPVVDELQHNIPAHQRPDGVLGEWKNIAEEEWNAHQRVAEMTGGWATVASLISVVGGVTTAKGLYDFVKGKHTQGVVEIGIGRALDLADGYVSELFGTRSKTGAFVDASVDKLLVAGASIALPASCAVSKKYAVATGVQQIRIATENAKIQKSGGEPNPSKTGKYGMAAIWGAFGTRAIETMLTNKNHDHTAKVAGKLALVAEDTSLVLTELAISGYRKQRHGITSKTSRSFKR